MFAALFLITVTGIALFLIVAGLTHAMLAAWHDSAVQRET
jgi:NitT/TauT family transport system permease protein